MQQPQLIGQSKQFNEKINTIKQQFFSALDDFQKYYVFFNKNPEVNEFQNYYSISKGQLQTMSRNLFLTTNDIEKNIESLDKQMSLISLKLEDEKNLNKEMSELIANLENTQNGSETMIDDTKTRYNIQYMKNWELFIGILFTGFFLGSIFKNKISVPVTK